MDIVIEKWKQTKYFCVYINGELLAVTVYKKGAVAIAEKVKLLYEEGKRNSEEKRV